MNIGKTFPFGFCFIILKKTVLFESIERKLDNLFFYNCLRFKVIYGDFAKSLSLAMTKQKAKYYMNRNPQKYILQLCK